MSDKQGKRDIKDFVGFAYYQPQDDIKIPYALFIFHTENGWKMKTCSFDRVAVRKKASKRVRIGHMRQRNDRQRR